MDLSNIPDEELIHLYSRTIKEMKSRNILRTKNVLGELGVFLAINSFNNNKSLPDLIAAKVGTQNYDAIDNKGNRYNIKATSGKVTGVFYGMENPGSKKEDLPVFDYVLVCKFDDNCDLENIYQLSWDAFIEHRRWHSRMRAWNITINKKVIADSVVVYSRDRDIQSKDTGKSNEKRTSTTEEVTDVTSNDKKESHSDGEQSVYDRMREMGYAAACETLDTDFIPISKSKYISNDKKIGLFISTATYSKKNKEYWYSIDCREIEWLKGDVTDFYITFVMGTNDGILIFDKKTALSMLSKCLYTKEDLSKGKHEHSHLSFALKQDRVFFKAKIPNREMVDVTNYLV